MKTKGGGKKKGVGNPEDLASQISCGIDVIDAYRDPDSVEENSGSKPVNGFSSPAPLTESFTEIHREEENLEEAEENGEEDEEEEDDEDGEESNPTAASSERKLDEGFYEIETIRRKRIRKGQLQYFIKWRGWPETANTWEPLENLQSCSDIIDSFEESLRSGKPRKRKRRQGIVHTLPKKKQQFSGFSTNNVGDVEIKVADKCLFSASNLSSSSQPMFSNCEADKNRSGKNNETLKHVIVENGFVNLTQEIDRKDDENEYDPKISELKASLANFPVNSDKLGVHFQEHGVLETNIAVDEVSKADRRIGARRRKSGSVKRFKQDLTLAEVSASQNGKIAGSGAGIEHEWAGNCGLAGESLNRNSKNDEPRNISSIIKIIKPIGYSQTVSNNNQEVLVTFMALRMDGTEVMVDNKFLKANNPLLLINFYEQHLRYNPVS